MGRRKNDCREWKHSIAGIENFDYMKGKERITEGKFKLGKGWRRG